MKAIAPYTQIFDDPLNEIPFDPNKTLMKIEQCGRVCYKSENHITPASARDFVSTIIKRGHESVLEHVSFCFGMDASCGWELTEIIDKFNLDRPYCKDYKNRCHLRITECEEPSDLFDYIISGNARAWRDFLKFYRPLRLLPVYLKDFLQRNPILFPEFQDDSNYIPLNQQTYENGYIFQQINPTHLPFVDQIKHADITVKFVTDRGISHEIVRHREASFSQESTRYCNYSKDKFNGEITVIMPPYLYLDSKACNLWTEQMEASEKAYFDLLEEGLTAQEARCVLPTSLKTELIMTANLISWENFFKLRCDHAAHPQMRQVAKPLLEDFMELIPGFYGNDPTVLF